jgi:hypothetical protein
VGLGIDTGHHIWSGKNTQNEQEGLEPVWKAGTKVWLNRLNQLGQVKLYLCAPATWERIHAYIAYSEPA